MPLLPASPTYGWLPVSGFESEPGRIMIELGAFGFVVAFALRIYLCWLAWQALLGGVTRTERAFAGAAVVFLAAHVISPIVFNVTGGALYWFMAGVVATILRDQHLRRAGMSALPLNAVLTTRALR